MSGLFLGAFPLPGFTPISNKNATAQLNNAQFLEVITRIINVALSRFKWKNLPETCNERALEMTLFFYGSALFFQDDTLGFIHTPVSLPGPFNVYYESIRREAYSFNYHKTYDDTNSVLIRANKTMTPDYYIAWNYAPKITDALRSIDVHTQTLKRPFAIQCEEKERKSVKAALENIKDNEFAVLGTKLGNADMYKVLNLAVQSHLADMWANAKNYFQQCYTALGIENTFTQKKERMVVSESEGESKIIRHIIESEKDCRERACEEINKMFRLNVEVEVNQLDQFFDERMEEANMFYGGGLNNNSGKGGSDDDDDEIL